MSPEVVTYYDNLISLYEDNLRISDAKTFTILFLLAFTMPAIIPFRPELPLYVPLTLLLFLPLSAILLLILSVFPCFIVTPGYPFFLRRSVAPDEFGGPPEDDRELLNYYRNPCASLAKILYLKVFYFRIAMGICLFYIAIIFVLAGGGALHEFSAYQHRHDNAATRSDRLAPTGKAEKTPAASETR